MFSGIDVFASRYAFSFDIEEASTILIPKIKASSYSIFILFSEFFGIFCNFFEFFTPPPPPEKGRKTDLPRENMISQKKGVKCY